MKKEINLPLKDQVEITATLTIPENSTSLIIFAHGSGSTGTSLRNQLIAQVLYDNGFSTILFDLLTKGETEIDNRAENLVGMIPALTLNKFNIRLLTKRLVTITEWVLKNDDTKNLDIGYFGASTGSAAALFAAATQPQIKFLISRSGRLDLVDKKTLTQVFCPCLFIVGSKDEKTARANKKALHQLKHSKNKKLEIVEGGSHLFEEEGKIRKVADLAVEWITFSVEKYRL